MATVEKLIDRLWKHPAGQKILQEEAADQMRDRQSHIAALAALDKHELAERPKLLKARDAAEQKRAQAIEAVRVAQAEFNQAFGATQNLSVRSTQQRELHHAALEATAPPEIDALISKLLTEMERLRHAQPDTIERRSLNPYTIGERIVTSNRAKLTARLMAINPAVAAARELKYQNFDAAKLAKRLEAIWDALPDTALSEVKA